MINLKPHQIDLTLNALAQRLCLLEANEARRPHTGRAKEIEDLKELIILLTARKGVTK